MLEEVICWNFKNQLVTEKNEDNTSVTLFSMNQFYSKKEEPYINELLSEVDLLKVEVRNIKSRLHNIEIDALAKKILKDAKGTSNGKKVGCSDNENSSFEDSSSPGMTQRQV